MGGGGPLLPTATAGVIQCPLEDNPPRPLSLVLSPPQPTFLSFYLQRHLFSPAIAAPLHRPPPFLPFLRTTNTLLPVPNHNPTLRPPPPLIKGRAKAGRAVAMAMAVGLEGGGGEGVTDELGGEEVAVGEGEADANLSSNGSSSELVTARQAS